ARVLPLELPRAVRRRRCGAPSRRTGRRAAPPVLVRPRWLRPARGVVPDPEQAAPLYAAAPADRGRRRRHWVLLTAAPGPCDHGCADRGRRRCPGVVD